DTDPVERIVPLGMALIIIRRIGSSPPTLAPLSLEEPERGLSRSQLETQVGRHSGGKILALVMHKNMNIPEADPQQVIEQRFGKRVKNLGFYMHGAVSFRSLHCVAAGAIVKRRQDDQVLLFFQYLEGAYHYQGINAVHEVFTVVFQYAQRQHY